MLNFQFMDLKTCFLSLYALLIFLEHMVLLPAFLGVRVAQSEIVYRLCG
jgi:hypothetical protein